MPSAWKVISSPAHWISEGFWVKEGAEIEVGVGVILKEVDAWHPEPSVTVRLIVVWLSGTIKLELAPVKLPWDVDQE